MQISEAENYIYHHCLIYICKCRCTFLVVDMIISLLNKYNLCVCMCKRIDNIHKCCCTLDSEVFCSNKLTKFIRD